jgi:hypothetical protein
MPMRGRIGVPAGSSDVDQDGDASRALWDAR